ncbi:Alpha/Beta hydrolase protein [Coniella lustricola]|uniref:Alpha/Beta hydrolase protein n=1 Tax=Coniella lustricola TaxID=2025994 RepID=A0A2T3A8A1_9PEZI|nr:Alpha/Beta hydrolase protein [Coniella lustricola]
MRNSDSDPDAMDWQSEPVRYHSQPSQLLPAHLSLGPKPNHAHTHTVIFLHGRGDTAANFGRGLAWQHSWTDAARRTPMDVFPSFRWVLSTAGVKACANAAVGSGSSGAAAMSQWFDVWGGAANLDEREEVQLAGLRDSVRRIRAVIDQEARTLGGRYDKIVLMGLSQGGATAVSTLLSLGDRDYEWQKDTSKSGPVAGRAEHQRLGALVGIACRMLFPGRTLAQWRALVGVLGDGDGDVQGEGKGGGANKVLQNTPVFLEHTVDDPLVRIEAARQLRDTLTAYGAKMEWKEYATGGHWFHSPQGLDDLAAFLTRVLPRD